MIDLPLIASLSNPLVKQARSLRQRKARAETGLFLVEGLHHVGEAIESSWDVETVLYAPDLLTGDFSKQLLEQAVRLPLRLQPVSAQVMESLAEKDNPQGILALVQQRKVGFEALSGLQRLAALVSPQDPGNVGAILRTMDAVGVDGLCLLDGGVDLYHPSLVRASMGALFWKPVVQASFPEFIKWVQPNSYQLIGASAHAKVDYRKLTPRIPWILLMGSEQKGLSRQQLSACEGTVSLPMCGRVSSLNLAVATGILLYAFNA